MTPGFPGAFNMSFGVEYLRTLHAILSDKEKYGFELGKHRRVYMNKMIHDITMPQDKILEIFTLNAELQSWHPELQKGIEPTIDYINLEI